MSCFWPVRNWQFGLPFHPLVLVANSHDSRPVGLCKMFKQVDLYLLRILGSPCGRHFRFDGGRKRVLNKDWTQYGLQLCKAIASGRVRGAIWNVLKSVRLGAFRGPRYGDGFALKCKVPGCFDDTVRRGSLGTRPRLDDEIFRLVAR